MHHDGIERTSINTFVASVVWMVMHNQDKIELHRELLRTKYLQLIGYGQTWKLKHSPGTKILFDLT